MASVQEIRRWLDDFLEGRISLERFEDWSASYSWDIHKSGNYEAQRLAYEIEGILSEHSQDADETEVRRELENVLHPFAPRTESVGIAFRIPSQWLVETAAHVEMIPIGAKQGSFAPGEVLVPTKYLLIDSPSADTTSTIRPLPLCVQPV